jgi:hypothetical protein
MEGHTDSKQYPAGAPYGNWELSADRANAARRMMQGNGIRDDQVTQVHGFADQRLRKADAPQDPSNRRIGRAEKRRSEKAARVARKKAARRRESPRMQRARKRERKRKSSADLGSACLGERIISTRRACIVRDFSPNRHNSGVRKSIQFKRQ